MVHMRGRRPSRSTLIVFLLVATLVMTAMLANEARQAARSHRATAENVLRDYSAFAVWELHRLGREGLLEVVQNELQRVQNADARDGLASALTTRDGCASGCGGGHAIRAAFEASLPDATFTFAGEPVGAGVRGILDNAVAEAVRAPDDFTCPALRLTHVDGKPAIVVWRPKYDGTGGRPVGLVGFVTDAGFVGHVFARILKHTPLLPPSLVREGGSPNSSIAVRVAGPEGTSLFSSSDEWSAYASEQALKSDMGSLKLAVALRPDAAGRLVIGGLPRERLPLVIGLLTLTAGLVIVALVQLRREAELSRLRSDFVSGVSHELRTPLAQIRMFTETLLLGRVRNEAEGQRSLEIIARETQRLAQLVENVLLFARGERRQPTITCAPHRMTTLVADTADSFANLAAARQSRIVTDLDDGVFARVDAGAIRQILLNLLDNAVKYGPAGQTVSVALRMHGDRARLTVDDEGTGIAPKDRERVWQPFNRLPHSAASTGGTGIGLSIVKQLTELHGGRAWVETGRGARFVVELPGAWSEAAASAVA